MNFRTLTRSLAVSFGLIALALIVSRCSPVNPSTAKHRTLFVGLPPTSSDKPISKDSGSITTQVIDLETFEAKCKARLTTAKGNIISLLDLTGGEFAMFRDKGSVDIKVSNSKMKSAIVLLEVSLTADQIKDPKISAFTTTFSATANNESIWTLSAAKDIDHDASSLVTDHLINVFVAEEASMASLCTSKSDK